MAKGAAQRCVLRSGMLSAMFMMMGAVGAYLGTQGVNRKFGQPHAMGFLVVSVACVLFAPLGGVITLLAGLAFSERT